MVHTRPDLPGRWTRYYQMNQAQRRQLARAQHQDYAQRLIKNRNRKIHPEQGMNINDMPNQRLHEIIHFQHWEHFIQEPQPYDPELVQEFYAAMVPPAFGEWSTVVIRGVRVQITMDDICRHYNVPRRENLDPTYGIPPIPNVAQDEQYSRLIAANLRRSGRNHWVPKQDMIKKTELRPEIAMCLRFVKCRLSPSTHYSTVDWYVARILYCLQNDMLLDIGHIIVLHMIDAAAERASGILPYPSLITKLCRDAGVRTGPMTPPPPPFDRSTYRAHIRSVNRIEQQGGVEEMSEEEEIDEEYNPVEEEEEEPEDPRIINRINQLEENMTRGFYNLSMLIRGQPVPDNAFPNPDGAGPSEPRPARQQRRRRHE